MRPCLVILAAGESRRLGACKALVDLAGRTPLDRLLAAGACLDGPPLVITGTHHAQIAAALGGAAQALFNPRGSEGRSTGVALAASHRPGRDLCIAPVDVPLVGSAVLEALAQTWERAGQPPGGWLAPCTTSGGALRYGHPVVLGRELLQRLDSLPAAAPLSELRRRADPLLAAEVPNVEILDDLDGPDDLERLQERLRARLP